MSCREQFIQAAIQLARESGVRGVRKWRSTSAGRAYQDGSITAPQPVGPVSFGVFAHECGHIALHKANGRYPRWREEVEAWEYALKAIQRFGLPGYERVEQKARRSVWYAFVKAVRRGVDINLIAETYPTWYPTWYPAWREGRLGERGRKPHERHGHNDQRRRTARGA